MGCKFMGIRKIKENQTIKEENKKAFNGYNKPAILKVAAKKAIKKGGIIENSTQAHLFNGISRLEKEFNEGTLIENVNIDSNIKLGNIKSIAFPNIFIQMQFEQLIKNNKSLLKLKVVKYLKNYFKKNKVCKNCKDCFGLCYNNKSINQHANKSISDLRTLLAFIIDKEALKNKIKLESKFSNLFRINTNGEIHSREMLDFWIELSNESQFTRFFTYTKSYQLFESYLNEVNELPKNFFLNISVFENREFIKRVAPTLWASCQKFEAVKKATKKDNTVVCKGNCVTCDGYCFTKLKSDTTIEVTIH